MKKCFFDAVKYYSIITLIPTIVLWFSQEEMLIEELLFIYLCLIGGLVIISGLIQIFIFVINHFKF